MVRSFSLLSAAVAGSAAMLVGASSAFEKHSRLRQRSSSSSNWSLKDNWTGEKIYQEWNYDIMAVDNSGSAQCKS